MNLELIKTLTTTISNNLMCTIAADLELKTKKGKPTRITILLFQDTLEHLGTTSRTQLWSGCLNRSKNVLGYLKNDNEKIMRLNTIVNRLNAKYITEKNSLYQQDLQDKFTGLDRDIRFSVLR